MKLLCDVMGHVGVQIRPCKVGFLCFPGGLTVLSYQYPKSVSASLKTSGNSVMIVLAAVMTEDATM